MDRPVDLNKIPKPVDEGQAELAQGFGMIVLIAMQNVVEAERADPGHITPYSGNMEVLHESGEAWMISVTRV